MYGYKDPTRRVYSHGNDTIVLAEVKLMNLRMISYHKYMIIDVVLPLNVPSFKNWILILIEISALELFASFAKVIVYPEIFNLLFWNSC